MSKTKTAEIIQKYEKQLDEIKALIIKARVGCSHRHPTKNKWYLRPLENGNPNDNIVTCTQCKVEFSLAQVSEQEALKAIEVVHTMVHQIILCGDDENIEDRKYIETLGNIDYSLPKVLKHYSDIVLNQGKRVKDKKKKKNNNRNKFGGFAKDYQY